MISLSAYARHRGVTLRAVQKAIEAGRISHCLNEKGHRQIVDIESTDREWDQNTDNGMRKSPTKRQKQKGIENYEQMIDSGEFGDAEIKPGLIKQNTVKPKKSTTETNTKANKSPDKPIVQKPKEESVFNKARTMREVADAKMKQLLYEEKAGTLVPIAKVKEKFFVLSTQIRDNMINITPRLASNLAATDDEFEITQMLDGEIRKALEGIANGRFEL